MADVVAVDVPVGTCVALRVGVGVNVVGDGGTVEGLGTTVTDGDAVVGVDVGGVGVAVLVRVAGGVAVRVRVAGGVAVGSGEAVGVGVGTSATVGRGVGEAALSAVDGGVGLGVALARVGVGLGRDVDVAAGVASGVDTTVSLAGSQIGTIRRGRSSADASESRSASSIKPASRAVSIWGRSSTP